MQFPAYICMKFTQVHKKNHTKKISPSLHMTRGEKKYILNAEESACKTSIKEPQSWHSSVDKQNCQNPKLLHQIRQYPVTPHNTLYHSKSQIL